MAEDPPLPPAIPPGAADVPRQLAAADAAWRPIGRAVRWATFDAWTLAVFAALSLPCGLGGVAGIVLAVVLGVTAIVEFVGVRRLRRLDATAPRLLALNQLALAAAIVIYSTWNLYLTTTGGGILPSIRSQLADAGLGGSDGAALARTYVEALYATLALVGGLVPALTAWFYASRAAAVRAYLSATPGWIVQMRRDRLK
jgi:hypothetical protein